MPRSSGLLSAAIRRGGILERSADGLAVPRFPGAILPDSHFGKPPQCFRLVAEKAGDPVGEVAEFSDGLNHHVVDGLEVAHVQPLVDVEVDGLVERHTPRAGKRRSEGPGCQPAGDSRYVARSGADKVRTLTGSASGGV